jgi:hypothetical protein
MTDRRDPEMPANIAHRDNYMLMGMFLVQLCITVVSMTSRSLHLMTIDIL